MSDRRLSMDAAGVIAHYVMDGDKPLTAESAGNTTFYLYGLGVIGEKTTAWSYSLPDGTNTPRQLTDMQGAVTLFARYTPWGDSLELHGSGNFSFGYLGGVLDATTGLLYVGNGQYYDPATGRFLTREVRPNSPNPYVPWNPIGAIVGPLGVIALVFGRRKKGSKVGMLLAVVVVVGSVGMTLAGCEGGGNRIGQQPAQPSNQNPVQLGPGTETGSGSHNPGSGIQTPTLTVTCTLTPSFTSTSTPVPTPTSVSTSTPVPVSCDQVSGKKSRNACKTYLALRDHPGWWNGNQIGTLTPQAFAGLLLRMEFNGFGGSGFHLVDHSIQQETVIRNFYAHCLSWIDNTCNPRSANDVFNFIGHKRLLDDLRPELILSEDADSNTIAMVWKDHPLYSDADFEAAFLNPRPEWQAGEAPGVGFRKWVPDARSPSGQSYVYTAPMDWGNISMITDPLKNEEAHRLIDKQRRNAEGLAEWQFFVVGGGGNSATIQTLSQRRYWRGS